MKNSIVATIFFLFAMSATVAAQEVKIINLEEAIEIALENNIEIELSRSDINRRESDVRQRRADFLPNLNASVSGTRTAGRQFDQANIKFDDITSHNLNANISSSIMLYNGFRNINQLRSARVGQESAEEMYQWTREQIIFEAASRFLDVLLAEELLDIERENLEASEKQLEQVVAQVEVGMSPVVEQYSQESIVANNELNVIRGENNLNLSKLLLARWLQLDPLGDYEFVAPGIREEDIQVRDYDLAEMVAYALENRRDVRASELNLQQTQYALRVSEGLRMPEVSLSGSISSAYRDQQRRPVLNGNNNNGNAESVSMSYQNIMFQENGGNGGNVEVPMEVMPFSDQFFDGNINRSLSFNVRIPIFNRWQTSNQIQQRKIDYRDAKLRYEDLQQEIFLELRQAYNDYIGYAKELEATEKAFIAAEKAYETEQERYNVGSATLIELTNTNNEYIRASSNRVQTMYQFIFQEKVLDYFLGRISEDVGIQALSY